ncbi:MAG: class I SAM-dependent methyltransferase [Actinomycetota bacterium]|nr:class I SAM-dependent methyltransferase [Actinomycetota bacterium]
MDRYEALRGPDGRALLDELAARSGEGALRLGTELRKRYPAELVVDALGQAELRDRAAAKFARAADMFFTRDGLEQASSEAIARHRARRFPAGTPLVDLCCGIGGDLVALGADHPVLGVDRDPVHLWMAEHNAEVHGVDVRTRESDVRDVALDGAGGVFVDPARRGERGRMATGDSEPPLGWCVELAGRVDAVGIKAAPGIAHDAVPDGWEIEFLSLGRDIKEAVLWSPAPAGPRARASVLPPTGPAAAAPHVHTLTGDPDPPDGDADVGVVDPGGYLLDPNPAVTRAGLVSELARRTGTSKIDPRIAFLTGDAPVATPFARTLQVIDSAPWNQKQLPARLRALDVGAVDVRRRGLAGDVDALVRKLRLTGSRHATLVMTRVRDRPWGLVCVDPGLTPAGSG